MIKHRRWFLSASGAAVISEIAGRLFAAKESLAADSPPRPKHTVPVTKPTPADLLNDFLLGYEENGIRMGGLRPDDVPKLVWTNVHRQRLELHYLPRLAHPLSTNWTLLPRQAAALGQLTRCMCVNVDNSTDLDVAHIEWAREALGFALNSSGHIVSHYKNSSLTDCGPIVIGRRKGGKEPDEPCALC